MLYIMAIIYTKYTYTAPGNFLYILILSTSDRKVLDFSEVYGIRHKTLVSLCLFSMAPCGHSTGYMNNVDRYTCRLKMIRSLGDVMYANMSLFSHPSLSLSLYKHSHVSTREQIAFRRFRKKSSFPPRNSI